MPDARGERPEQPDEMARLPQRRDGLPPERPAPDQSQRLLASLIWIVAERGYNAATVALITDDAGITPCAFYRCFDSLEACYLAAFDAVAVTVAEYLEAAWDSERDWPLRVRAAVAAALEFFSASPELAGLVLSEPFAAGATISRRHREELDRLAVRLAEGRTLSGQDDVLPPTTERGILGSVASRIARKVSAGEADRLPAMLPDLTLFALTPYLGTSAAREFSLRG